MSYFYQAGMDLIKFIFYMGVVQIVFSTMWKFIATIVSSLLKEIGIDKDLSFLFFKGTGYYILVSISALVTIDLMKEVSSFWGILVAVAGLFIIYTTIAGNLEKNRWRAVMNFERKRVRVMRYDGILLITSLALYLVTLIVPEIANNPVNSGFRSFIDDVYHAPIIGWFVRFGALFYMISIIFKGIRATDYVMNLLFQPGTVDNTRQVEDVYEGEYTDYVEIKEEE